MVMLKVSTVAEIFVAKGGRGGNVVEVSKVSLWFVGCCRIHQSALFGRSGVQAASSLAARGT
jgi:hypothetical protein